ncbi:10079_t:CDS:2 [Dentiscutata erythropus]|uniref:10079_t:CDS:1 n=1 Tax=Dentiscutata erythropus TaxID=1348616 RepID=A0A9N8W193_9GLOM|nr:10079_t:CDS:2 [Dentiscutata erythropus]
MRRRINGLKHMIYVNDPVLRNCQLPRLYWNEYLRDLESAVNDLALQSAEESDTDEEFANDERENDERPANIYDTNNITCILHRCGEVDLFRKSWHNENYIDYNRRPKDDAPSWWTSTEWSSSNVESGENEADRSDGRKDNYMREVEIFSQTDITGYKNLFGIHREPGLRTVHAGRIQQLQNERAFIQFALKADLIHKTDPIYTPGNDILSIKPNSNTTTKQWSINNSKCLLRIVEAVSKQVTWQIMAVVSTETIHLEDPIRALVTS